MVHVPTPRKLSWEHDCASFPVVFSSRCSEVTAMAGLSGMDVPEYLEDIKALEEVLSPTLTLPGRWSPGGERRGEGTAFSRLPSLWVLPSPFWVFCGLEKHIDFRSRQNWVQISALFFVRFLSYMYSQSSLYSSSFTLSNRGVTHPRFSPSVAKQQV